MGEVWRPKLAVTLGGCDVLSEDVVIEVLKADWPDNDGGIPRVSFKEDNE